MGRGLKHVHFAGELLLGHLRYGTHGASGETFCHRFAPKQLDDVIWCWRVILI